MSNIEKRIDKIKRVLDPNNLARQAYPVFVKNTPIRSGNARSKTHLQGDTIEANYAYAQRLDNGWSKQSPDGMVEPTVKYIREYIRKQLGV